MCHRCAEKYQGMPLSQAKDELELRLAETADFFNQFACQQPTPQDFVDLYERGKEVLQGFMSLARHVQIAQGAGLKHLDPENSDVEVKTAIPAPIARMLGVPLSPQAVQRTWADVVGSVARMREADDDVPPEIRL